MRDRLQRPVTNDSGLARFAGSITAAVDGNSIELFAPLPTAS